MKALNKKFIFFDIKGVIIPQDLESEDFGEVTRELVKQKAVLIPVICHANNVRHAFDIYQEKISNHSTYINGNKVIKSLNI
ncbi:hypothetical protein [Vibrio tetraodonis]|uniref:hypothetical protein n=1 Tax=Vibrio tetraodonis TaxID=2231647 RepID=UPI000E0ACB28|nr:hypothetical protein [Vibrio tetraodonis]